MQDIEATPNFLLNKVYRTHPQNLMFAHAVGMGLFEIPTINWLDENGWNACGYNTEVNGRNYVLSRERVLRFEELDEPQLEFTKIIPSDEMGLMSDIVNTLQQIIENHPDVKPDDIAIIFTKNKLSKADYDFIASLQSIIYSEFNWNSSVTYKEKRINEKKLTISNKNNIKGLEFPFVICIANHIVSREFTLRNTLYMSLTRSFLTSYLIIEKLGNEKIIETFIEGLSMVQQQNKIETLQPTPQERATQRRLLSEIREPKKSQYEVLEEIFELTSVALK